MLASVTRSSQLRCALFVLAALAIVAVPAAHAAVTSYVTTLSGPAESPPNASPGTGVGQVDIDPVAHTLTVIATFSGLTGNVTLCHIHAPTAAAGSGTAGVATMTPTFAGFPAGVTAGAYSNTFDTSVAGTFNASYVTANGGTAAGAEAALFQAIADGKAYLNIHTTTFGSGEIRGFLVPNPATPALKTSWQRVKSLYR